MESSTPFRILTVCTGNICRSPVAERLLQLGFDAIHPGRFEVRSAGIAAMAGQAMQPFSNQIVQAHGGTSAGFVARQLTQPMLGQADLVLAMTKSHRSEVLRLMPSRLKRTFTIREFARMLDALKAEASGDGPADLLEQWHGVPAAAAAVRHLTLASAQGEDDVVDPFRKAKAAYRQLENELIPALDSILRYAGR